jgi:hypothetical protein
MMACVDCRIAGPRIAQGISVAREAAFRYSFETLARFSIN